MNITLDQLKEAIYEGFKLSNEGYNFECFGSIEEPDIETFLSEEKERIDEIIEKLKS